jgi:hypothetical protein
VQMLFALFNWNKQYTYILNKFLCPKSMFKPVKWLVYVDKLHRLKRRREKTSSLKNIYRYVVYKTSSLKNIYRYVVYKTSSLKNIYRYVVYYKCA